MITLLSLVSVMVLFEPPTQYEDNTPLLNSEITEYRYEIYSNTEPANIGTFINTGQKDFTVDLNVGWYAVCMLAKTTQWSELRCTIAHITNPSPPVRLCN